MNPLRSILVHLDASPRSIDRLAFARELGASQGASVSAWYANAPSAIDLPFLMSAGAGQALETLQELEAARNRAALDRFVRTLRDAPESMRWEELQGAPLVRGTAQRALYCDLMVLGQHDPDDLTTLGIPSDFAASVIIESGKPGLIVPYIGRPKTLGTTVLIAWKPTREAARALSAALPLLRRATRLHWVAAVDSDTPLASPGLLEAFMRDHGVGAPLKQHGAVAGDSAGEGLLSRAADVGADLLVMGCYGHSRAREFVVGGATRTVLQSMTLPVLMAH